MKINHNEFLTYPNKFDQIFFAHGQAGVGHGRGGGGRDDLLRLATSRPARSSRSAQAFQAAHEMGMATVLWCYLRNPAFKTKEKDYHVSADLTGQANHLGVTIEADIIKQKLPENNGGYNALSSKENPYGKTDKRIYTELTTDHPIDLCRYQVANCYMGRIGLINSGGASGENDFAEAVKTAVINKRAGGMGLISGRKAFQRPMAEGVKLLNAIQDVYLCKDDHESPSAGKLAPPRAPRRPDPQVTAAPVSRASGRAVTVGRARRICATGSSARAVKRAALWSFRADVAAHRAAAAGARRAAVDARRRLRPLGRLLRGAGRSRSGRPLVDAGRCAASSSPGRGG